MIGFECFKLNASLANLNSSARLWKSTTEEMDYIFYLRALLLAALSSWLVIPNSFFFKIHGGGA